MSDRSLEELKAMIRQKSPVPPKPSVDVSGELLIHRLRDRAYLCASSEAPRVSKEAVILNDCANALERLYAGPLSEYDRLMK